METSSGSLSESRRPDSAEGLADRLKQDSRQQIESRKRSAADRIDEIAHALGRAGEQLQSQPRLAAYTDQLAGSVGNLATRIRDGSVDQLTDDARQFARRNPGLFVLGGFAAGVVLARFLKASGRASGGEEFSSDFTQAAEAQEEEYAARAHSSPVERPAATAGVEQPYSSAPTPRSDGG